MNDFFRKIDEKNRRARREREDKIALIKDIKEQLVAEIKKDDSEMSVEEKKVHVEKIRALSDYLERETRGINNRNNKNYAIEIGLKIAFTVLCIAFEAALLNSGKLTRMKEKLIDNIMRIH